MVSATLDLVTQKDAQPTSSATIVQLTHECGTDGCLAGACRELIG